MKSLIAAALVALALPAAAHAQDASAVTAPDGTRAFGIEPYVGVLGGYASYDRDSKFGVSPTDGRLNGYLAGGVAGINLPLGPVFVGVEGNAAKGFDDIDWEYGAKGRAGVRAGNSGMIFVSAGYEWVNARSSHGFDDHHGWTYGAGLEVGPKDLGMTGNNSGLRLRLEADTAGNFRSIQPMAGVVFHL